MTPADARIGLFVMTLILAGLGAAPILLWAQTPPAATTPGTRFFIGSTPFKVELTPDDANRTHWLAKDAIRSVKAVATGPRLHGGTSTVELE